MNTLCSLLCLFFFSQADVLEGSQIRYRTSFGYNRIICQTLLRKSYVTNQTSCRDLGESRAARFAYDNGTLEIMTPLPEHEYYKETIGDTVKDIAEVLEQDYASLGSTTWKREIQKAGVEPDNCFYFQNEPKIRGKLQFNLEQDPPPDLALEIDVTSKSLSRFPIYARLGVPEIWCYDSGELKIYQQEIPELIEQNRYSGRLSLRKAVRAWAREKSGEL
ncbi:MAG: Uma2 family endonuclease [Oscillatoriales cyanobacterium]|nr:MAG: Uma2 family endonuclease [Oscillatoriales cyanobacterium]